MKDLVFVYSYISRHSTKEYTSLFIDRAKEIHDRDMQITHCQA